MIVILIIGGIILAVLNIFNVRERKYEVGVLTAMGMKKRKVAAQFMCEILVITMIVVVIGAGIGAVSSVPVTNAPLSLLSGLAVPNSAKFSMKEKALPRSINTRFAPNISALFFKALIRSQNTPHLKISIRCVT